MEENLHLISDLKNLPFGEDSKIYKSAYAYTTLMAYYKSACMEIRTKFDVMNEAFRIQLDRKPIVSIATRVKQPFSIKEKLERYGKPLSVESIHDNLNDVAGIRVVCSFLEDVYMLEKALLSQDDITLIQKKDYIKNPKPNGYRSLHLIVEVPIFLSDEKKMMRAEIQLRTIAMECWATLEHQINYKKDGVTDESIEQLRMCADMSTEIDTRMQKIWRDTCKLREEKDK